MTDTDALLNALVETVTRLSSELGELRGEVQYLRAWRDGVEAQRFVTASPTPAQAGTHRISEATAPQISESRFELPKTTPGEERRKVVSPLERHQGPSTSPPSAKPGEEELLQSLQQAMMEEVADWESRLATAQANYRAELSRFHQSRKRQRDDETSNPVDAQRNLPPQHADRDDPTEWDYFAKPREEPQKPQPKASKLSIPQPLPRAEAVPSPEERAVAPPAVAPSTSRPLPRSLTFDKPRPPSPPLPRRRDRVPLAKILQERQKAAEVAEPMPPAVADPSSAAPAASSWPQPIPLAVPTAAIPERVTPMHGLPPSRLEPIAAPIPLEVGYPALELTPFKANPTDEAPHPVPQGGVPQLTVLSQSTPRSTVSPTQDH